MPNAFNGLGASAPYVPDYLQDEIQFRIDNDLRTIAIPADGVVLGVVGDKNVNHVNFQMPAWYNGFNMSLFQARINFIDASGNANYYTVTDMTVMTPEGTEVTGVPSENDIIYFTWLVDSYATGYVGSVRFNVRLTKHDTSVNPAVLSQAFNTQVNSCQVLEGIQLADEITQEQAEDLLFHLSSELGDIAEGFKRDIEAKAAETIETVPDDYTEISTRINTATRRVNNVRDILGVTADGNLLNMQDSTVRSGGYYASSGDGQVPVWTTLATFSQSNIMPGVKGERIYFRRNGVSEWVALSIAFFDEDFDPISSIGSLGGEEYITIPDNDDIAYFSVPINMTYVDSTVISKSPITEYISQNTANGDSPRLVEIESDISAIETSLEGNTNLITGISRSGGFYETDSSNSASWTSNSDYGESNLIEVEAGDVLYFHRENDSTWPAIHLTYFGSDGSTVLYSETTTEAETQTVASISNLKYVAIPIKLALLDDTYVGREPYSGSNIGNRINKIESMLGLNNRGENLLNMADSTVRSGGYYNPDATGVPTWNTLSSFSQSNLIRCSSNETIYFRRNGVNGWADVPISFFTSSGTPLTYKSATEGAFYETVPNNSAIAYFSVPINMTYVDSTVISKSPITGYVPQNTTGSGSGSGSGIPTQEYNHWAGKTWYAYGTSLTNTSNEGKYAKYLEQLSGMVRVNKGISGGGLVATNANIKAAIMNTTDGKLTADLITLETGANDSGVLLGTIYDTGDDTYCGALNQCIRYLQANTNAQIVVMTSTVARFDGPGSTTLQPIETELNETDHHTKWDQWKAIRDVCMLNSVPCIGLGDASGMGIARMAASNLYNVDQIHHSELGGYNLAQYVWGQLKNIPLWYTSIPT